ncbi:hypothetical protein L596_023129 [Steinernema carpocapsae]|uniref:START domain-containing protein 10 n=1 Tax=Steinernema carpocapsae TaxID=34508 RepID=A0A4U5MCY4_STECR|nr:hypothetical protein L596_023129 [Steinernema carpocapsae]
MPPAENGGYKNGIIGPSEAMRVNVVKVLEDSDFTYVKNLCDDHRGWDAVYAKKGRQVWMKAVPDSSFQMIKARAEFPDVPASVAYDVLQDPHYRQKWDRYVAKTDDIGIINPYNDLCYYALASMSPLKSRDFVMQRSWLDTGAEKYICSHSVCHDKYPPLKGYVRGIVHLTGYFVREMGTGCQLTYITHSDPRGQLPTWIVNRLTKTIAPKLIKKLHKACLNYPQWKAANRPHWKPWANPDQQSSCPRINLSECRATEYEQTILDESNLEAAPNNDENEED